jgi:hypothetical protein
LLFFLEFSKMVRMFWRYLTAALIPLVTTAILGYDWLADRFGGNISSISRTILNVIEEFPSTGWVVCFLLGLLATHFNVAKPGTGADDAPWEILAAVIGIPLVVLFVNLGFYIFPETMRACHGYHSDPLLGLVRVWIGLTIGSIGGYICVAQHQGA